jgi:hypothetical protein
VVFSDEGGRVREPYLAIAVDGTLLAVRSYIGKLRRSEDAGKTWGKIQDIDIRILDSNLIVDENTGDIRSIRMWDGSDRAILSKDHGRTWTTEEVIIKPSARMKELAQSGTKARGTEGANKPGTYFMHANASESGVTLRHGKHKGRLIISATYRPNAKEHPSDRMTVWASFDGGRTWPVKRLVYKSFSAYSSLVAGRPGTPTEGLIFLLFEGGPKGRYAAMQVARLNLSWILQGEGTGDGDVPPWVRP